MSAEDVGKLLGVDVPAVIAMKDKRQIPQPTFIDHQLRWESNEIKTWLEQRQGRAL